MAFGNRWWLRVHHTEPSTLGWSVVVGLSNDTKAIDNQPKKYSTACCIALTTNLQIGVEASSQKEFA